eukprot:Anaeramoba_ignava/a101033_27.p1 GENE.a101033_27~~a101033_27.p1  ORF type:complete len:154 (+),score=55.83 a101033_27:22-462(+)
MSIEAKKTELLYKVVVVGDPNVGKTSFLRKLTTGEFSINEKRTLGVDYRMKTLVVNNTEVNIQFWDIAGDSAYGSLTKIFYRNTSGAFVVFDVTDQATFENVKRWKQDLDEKTDSPKIPVILIGNKSDKPLEIGIDLNQYAQKKWI